MATEDEDLGLTGYGDRCRQDVVGSDCTALGTSFSQILDDKSFNRIFYAATMISHRFKSIFQLY
jgi:hypothetical protein